MSVAQLWADTRVAGRMFRMAPGDRREFEALELRIRALLPAEYRDRYEDVQPVPMGSAPLRYDDDGRVAWHDIWDSFCDLAMAGGPPHKGRLLMPASREEIDAEPERCLRVAGEICRGVSLVTGFPVAPSPVPGWVRVECADPAGAAWLARAIVMENVSARCDPLGADTALDLPAGPRYRLEKEIKNVITVMAKTSHYWLHHAGAGRQREITALLAAITAESPLIQPAEEEDSSASLHTTLAGSIQKATGLRASEAHCAGWLGLDCPSAKAAIWMMRALVATNVLARREETVLFVPVNPATDPSGAAVLGAIKKVYGFARVRGVV